MKDPQADLMEIIPALITPAAAILYDAAEMQNVEKRPRQCPRPRQVELGR